MWFCRDKLLVRGLQGMMILPEDIFKMLGEDCLKFVTQLMSNIY